MVTRLEGLINGEGVIFSRKGGDVWECTFPSVEGCELIIELQAYDDAGNYCYSARYILLFDPDSLVLRLIPLTDWLEKQPEDLWLECTYPCDCVLAKLLDETVLECVYPCDYWLEYLGGETNHD